MIDVTPSLSKSFVFEMVVTRTPYASDGVMRTDEVTRNQDGHIMFITQRGLLRVWDTPNKVVIFTQNT